MIIEPKYAGRPEHPPKPLPCIQIGRYRAVVAFQLRAWGLSHDDIRRVMNFTSKEHSRRMVAKGRRLFTEIIIPEVAA